MKLNPNLFFEFSKTFCYWPKFNVSNLIKFFPFLTKNSELSIKFAFVPIQVKYLYKYASLCYRK